MYRQIVPRFCRQMRNCQLAAKRGYKRDFPVRLPRTLAPFNNFFSDMRPTFFNNFDRQFREMEKMMEDMSSRFSPFYMRYRPREAENVTRTEAAEVKYDNKTFEVKVDVQQYDIEHLKVSQVEDRLVISGKHESKADEHGYVSREFSREFLIPENVDTESMSSRLTEDGYLLIEANIKGAKEAPERIIEIQKEENKDKTSE